MLEAVTYALETRDQFETLEQRLQHRLKHWRDSVETRRMTTLQAVEIIRQSATAIRLAQTIWELYESLIAWPRKSQEAQRADLEWHAQAGVKPLVWRIWQDPAGEGFVGCEVEGHPFSIVCKSFELSNISFFELTLFDSADTVLARVRVRADEDTRQVEDSVILACRPGRWIHVLADLRVRMDERRESVLMRTRYQELTRMRSDFGLDDDLRGQGVNDA